LWSIATRSHASVVTGLLFQQSADSETSNKPIRKLNHPYKSAHAETINSNDAEIGLLKQQLKLMEQKLDKLQKRTAAKAAAAANANAKAEARIINAPKKDAEDVEGRS
jgi:hypothetical protein